MGCMGKGIKNVASSAVLYLNSIIKAHLHGSNLHALECQYLENPAQKFKAINSNRTPSTNYNIFMTKPDTHVTQINFVCEYVCTT